MLLSSLIVRTNFALSVLLSGQVCLLLLIRRCCLFANGCPEQSRRCPLCSQSLGEYLIHDIRSKYDYSKHYLTPPSTSPGPTASQAQDQTRFSIRRRVEREWGVRRRRESEREGELQRAISKRRWIYENDLYAKVCCPKFTMSRSN